MFKKPSQARSDSSSGERVDLKELAKEGALVVFTFREHKEEVTTTFGVKEAVSADLFVVTGSKAGQTEEDKLIFNIGVVNTMRDCDAGDVVLGRLSSKSTNKGNPAVVLSDPNDGDEQLAERALASSGAGASGKSDKPPF